MSTTALRLGVIGCGGRMRHLLARLPQQAVPWVYADVQESAARAALDRFGGGWASADPARVLAADGIDAVLIATRHDSHAPLAIAAARAGKHLLLEKPLALDLADCAAIVSAVEAAGVTCLLGHKLRFAPLFRRLQQEMPRPLLSTVHILDQRWADGSWTVDPVAGGGNIFSQGCHGADLALALHGEPAVRVAAAGGALTHPGLPVPDVLAAAVTFASGAVCALTCGDAGLPALSKFVVQAADGRRAAVLRDRLALLELDGEAIRPDPAEDPEGDSQLLAEFCAAAAARRAPESGATARDGWRAMRLLHAAWDAARSGLGREISD